MKIIQPNQQWIQTRTQTTEQKTRIHSEQRPQIHTTQKPRIHPEQKPQIHPEQRPQIHTTQKPRMHPEQKAQMHSEQKPQVHPEQKPRIHPEQKPQVHPEQKPRIHPEQKAQIHTTQKPQEEERLEREHRTAAQRKKHHPVQPALRKIINAGVICLAISGCMTWDDGQDDEMTICPDAGPVLFIANEGQFGYGNASLSCYSTATGQVENSIFQRANGQKLGDTAQSMTLHDGTLWITVNNSNVIFAVDPLTFKEKGRITDGLASPRYIHFVSKDKAYVTQMGSGDIAIVDPSAYAVSGNIDTGATSTEQIVQIGQAIFVNCWSDQKEILRIDPASDKVTARLETGIQPVAIRADCNGKLWVMNDGGGYWTEVGSEQPTLKLIDTGNMTVEKTFTFPEGSYVASMDMNSDKDSLFFLNGGIYAMSIEDTALPETPLIAGGNGRNFYDFTVRPGISEIYVSDAIDYQQNGTVYRYSSDGKLRDSFEAGVCPGSFCWY